MITKKAKKISVLVVCILAISVLTIGILANTASASAYVQINSTFSEIEKQISSSMDFDGKYYINGLPLALSSNPYDYVVNNSEYDKLVAKGPDAIDAIEECLSSQDQYSGLERYILAIALEDIAKVDLKNYETYNWEDGDSFLASWEQMKADVVNEVPRVMSDAGLSEKERWAEITRFGILAIKPLETFHAQLRSSDSTGKSTSGSADLASKMINLLSTSNKDTITGIACSKINPPG